MLLVAKGYSRDYLAGEYILLRMKVLAILRANPDRYMTSAEILSLLPLEDREIFSTWTVSSVLNFWKERGKVVWAKVRVNKKAWKARI